MPLTRLFAALTFVTLVTAGVIPAQTARQPDGPVLPVIGPGISSAQTYYCSRLGCPTDGVTPIDSIVQPLLNTASASNPVTLILDGAPLYRTNGLYYTTNTTICGLGQANTRLKILAGAAQHVLRIGAAANTPTDVGGPPPAQTAVGIGLCSITIDGNRGTGYGISSATAAQSNAVGNGNSTFCDQRGLLVNECGYTGITRWLFDFDATNAQFISVRDVDFVNAPAYSFRASNVSYVWTKNVRYAPFGPTDTVAPTNTDGAHFSGSARYVWLDDTYCRTGDDCIALNVPEGYTGSQSDIHIKNVVLDGSQTAVRLLAAALVDTAGTLSNVSISHVEGSVNVAPFIFGLESVHAQNFFDNISNIDISDVRVASPYFALISDSFTGVSFNDVHWVSPTQAAGMFENWTNPTTWTGLSVRNSSIVRNAAGHASVSVIGSTALSPSVPLTVRQLDVSNFSVEDQGHASIVDYPSLPLLNLNASSTVRRMVTTGLSPLFNNLLAISGTAATSAQYKATFTASSVTSTDLAHMAAIPDAVPALGTSYFSSDNNGALTTVQNAAIPTAGLIYHWKMNEGTGATSVDTVAGNTLTYSNASWTTDAVLGKIPVFTGAQNSSATAASAANTGFTVGQPFSIAGWMNLPTDSNGEQVLAGNLDSTTKGVRAYIEHDGSLVLQVLSSISGSSYTVCQSAPATVPLGQGNTQSIIFTFDGQGTANQVAYVGGTAVAVPCTASSNALGSFASTAPFTIGGVGGSPNTHPFSVGEVAIYNRVLSAADAAQIVAAK